MRYPDVTTCLHDVSNKPPACRRRHCWRVLAAIAAGGVFQSSDISGYLQTFIVPVIVIAVTYYLPAYYQACKGASPIRAGVDALGMTLMLGPSVILTGASVTILKVYRVQLWMGWAILMIAMGLLSTLKWDTELSRPIGFSTVVHGGAGMLYAATYYPVLAPLPISENAHALAFFAFCRTFASVWGVTIGGTILQNQLSAKLPVAFTEQLPKGIALAYSSIPAIANLSEPLRSEVRQAFGESIAVIWQTMIGIAGLGLLSAIPMRALPLHTQVDERWGIDESVDRGIALDTAAEPEVVRSRQE